MKKTFLKNFNGASLLSKQETKTITGGYGNGSFLGTACSYILCPANSYNPRPNTSCPNAGFPKIKEVYVYNGSQYVFQQYCYSY
jgi:hypothetical protein